MDNKGFFKEYRLVIILFVLTTLIIVSFLPRGGKFKYEFQMGKSWSQETLIAPYNFPIYKSENALVEEKLEIVNNFNAYYVYDSLVSQVQLSLFKNQLDSKIIKKRIDSVLINAFNKIYKQGILNVNPSKTHNQVVSVITNNISEDHLITDFYTISSAFDYLKTTINTNIEHDELDEIINSIDLKQYIQANLIYDEKLTNKVRDNRLELILPTQGMVLEGDKIIERGEMITSSSYQVLLSLKREYEEKLGFSGNWYLLIIGQFLFIGACLSAIFIALFLFKIEILKSSKYVIFILILINLLSIASLLIIKHNQSLIYLVPVTIIPIYIATFFFSRSALFVHWIFILLIGNFVPNSFEFILLSSIAGVVAIWGFKHLYRRGQLFLAIFCIFISYSFLYIVTNLLHEGSFASISWPFLFYFAANSLLILTLYQFTFIFEKLFGFLSSTRLIELSDTNQELLRQLAEVAPGTFQHSLQVANLSEAAIREINGDVLLVRTGALYHDIGKMKNPDYFIENQSSGYNPHNNIAPEESAKIIIDHVQYGIELAHKYKLPEAIIDFIRTHHGTSTVFYFYSQYKKLHPDKPEEEIRPLFTYPGKPPRTKEAAVLMIADAAEAASRSLKVYTKQSISDMVENIISYKLNEGYFNNANITLAELTIVKSVIKQKLQNIYHNRIEYPEMKNTKPDQTI